MITVLLVSLAAAACFGVSSALQHAAVGRARPRAALSPGLLVEVARRPGWQLGALIQVTGVALHLYAVNLGALSVVQPLLTVGLVIALEAQRLSGRRIPDGARSASALVIVGLAVFLVGTPEPGSELHGYPLAGGLFAGAVLIAALVAGLRRAGGVRAIAFGAAAGTLMATSAATGKAWGTILRTEGWPELLSSWQLWVGLALGLGGLLVSQAAFQAGPLAGPLASMMAVDPVIGVVLGVVMFGEPLDTGFGMVRQVAGLTLAVVGVVLLARVQGRMVGEPRESRPGVTASA